MSAYLPLIKQWHIFFALASLTGFFLRGLLMWFRSDWLQHRFVKRAPHIVDSLLFLLGLTLLWLGPWSFATATWLQVKLGALLIYIGLGFIALRRGRFAHGTRIAAWFSALAVFAYMLAVAHTKQIWPG